MNRKGRRIQRSVCKAMGSQCNYATPVRSYLPIEGTNLGRLGLAGKGSFLDQLGWLADCPPPGGSLPHPSMGGPGRGKGGGLAPSMSLFRVKKSIPVDCPPPLSAIPPWDLEMPVVIIRSFPCATNWGESGLSTPPIRHCGPYSAATAQRPTHSRFPVMEVNGP